MNDYKKASEIIDSIFSGFDKNKLEMSNNLANIWNNILNKITIDGQRLADHSRIHDLKNNMLIIEVDHVGWIQVLQFHKKFILKELKKTVSILEIKTLSFKLNK
ncbi:MAG: DciA family protein [Treponemataceae bacterium]